jgi:uncharacterized protein DUF4189
MQSHRSSWSRSSWRRYAGLMSIVALLLAAGAMRPTSAVADGALAVASPPDVVKQGFAYGYVTDYPDAKQADAEALKKCRDTTLTAIRPMCKVIKDFKNQCVAVAMDPKAGTPGVGWGVADDVITAEREALGKCENTAGQDRRASCAVDHSSCDGTAK